MEPFSFIIQVVAAAALSALPTPPATVPGTVEVVSVSNTSVISQTSEKVVEDKAAKEKAVLEAVAKAVKEQAEKTPEAKAEDAKTAEKEHLQLPLAGGSYSYVSDFGLRCAPVTGAGNFHYGMDLAAPNGTDMFSIADGTVVSVTDGAGALGGDVRIESTINGKLMTLRYHHMGNSSQYVKVGDVIKAGKQISDVASTGMSTGPHLHLEVYEGKFAAQKHRDPEEYFKEIGLPIVAKASANYVNKHDHPTSCPGGTDTSKPSTVPVQVASSPAKPNESAPAKPAKPETPAPANTPPAKPVTPTPRPTETVKPTPTPVPVPTPTPVPTPKPTVVPTIPAPVPTAIPTPVPSILPTVPAIPTQKATATPSASARAVATAVPTTTK